MAQDYLKPKVASPRKLREKKNGQFSNPPLYMAFGGMKSASKLHRDTETDLKLQKSGWNKKGPF